jgi:hypothetical protein
MDGASRWKGGGRVIHYCARQSLEKEEGM